MPEGLDRGLEWVPADESAWARVLEGSEVDTEIPELGWMDYLGDLLTSLLSGIANWLTGHVSVGVLSAFVELTKWGLAIGLLTLAVLLLRRLLRRLRRREIEVGHWQADPAGPEASTRRSLAEWHSEFRRCLSSGDVRGSLQALWWAMASRLAPSQLDDSWTTDEVLESAPASLSARRRSLLLHLDRLLYRGDPLESKSLQALASRVFTPEALRSAGPSGGGDS